MQDLFLGVNLWAVGVQTQANNSTQSQPGARSLARGTTTSQEGGASFEFCVHKPQQTNPTYSAFNITSENDVIYPASPPNWTTKYGVGPCPLEQHIEAFSDSTPLLAGHTKYYILNM